MKSRCAAFAIPLCLAATMGLGARLHSLSDTPGSTGADWVAEVLFLFDRSADCSAHFGKAKDVADEVFRRVDNIFPLDTKIGFATFTDKDTLPFGSFGDEPYSLQVPLTTNHTALVTKIKSLDSYGGGDSKDAQLDALYFGAVGQKVGWSVGDYDSQGKPILRIVVMVTNSAYHSDSDGKENGMSDFIESGVIDWWRTYPSLSHIHKVYDSESIHTVFLIGDIPISNYWGLRSAVSKTLTARDGRRYRAGMVEALESNSTNLLEVLDSSINGLLSKIEKPTPIANPSIVVTPKPPAPAPSAEGSGSATEILVLYELTTMSRGSWQKVKDSTRNLVHGLRSYFYNARIAIGSFGNKPGIPSVFGAVDDYCYKTELPMTDDIEALVRTVDTLEAKKGGGVFGQAQLDALYYGLKSPSVGWRTSANHNGFSILRLVIMVTPSSYQTVWPGKPNIPTNMTDEGQCGDYNYATVGQVKAAFQDMRALPMFFTFQYFKHAYDDLVEHIGRWGTTRSIDSTGSNFLQEVKKAIYQMIFELT